MKEAGIQCGFIFIMYPSISDADADLVLADAGTLVIDTVLAKGKVMVRHGQVLVKGTFES